ncbi:hypothetical protein DEU56DRAFT_759842 [Suillus clintonianus]|uniref:uncharacterized protein n=1 Tax=Suillus clintonianus TaxID=1904413 RepID=UPI001B86A5B1|nr:uncharacterized protein DEU56DRAFT_759842 [Suillus clintonianus]KAG2123987.1 hypothetical protein DEU56DRAFT_759842 [Suillus clintonianus]
MNDTHDRTCSFRTYRVMLLVTVQRVCISQAHHVPTRMFKEAGHDVVDDRVLSRGYWEALQEHPGGSKIIPQVQPSSSFQVLEDERLSCDLIALQGVFHHSHVVQLHTSKLKVNVIRDYSRLIMRQFNPVPYYEDSQFVFGATGAESAYTTSAEASSSAAEGGCSTPPTEYTPEHETSQLPYFAIDPTLLDDAHDPTSKKRKLDSLHSEQEDHDVNMPTLTGTHGRAGHPPTRRFQSPFLPASKKICPLNQKTSNLSLCTVVNLFYCTIINSFLCTIINSFLCTIVNPSNCTIVNSSNCTSMIQSSRTSLDCSTTPSRSTITSKKQVVLEPQASLTPTRSFLVHKPNVNRPHPKPKPVGNAMQPLAFSKNTIALSSHSKLPQARNIPPIPQDDSDNAQLDSGLLTHKSIGGSSKDKVSAHSRSQLESGRQHSMLQNMQGEILQLRKEQSRISQDHSVVTNRIDMQVEAIIRHLEALKVQDPQSAPSRTDNSMNSAIRQVLQKMMGIETNEALPAPVDNANEFWADIDELTIDNEIFKTLKSLTGKVFKNMKQKYKEAEKPISVQSLNVQSARREKRQLDKAALASAVRPDFPPLAGEEYDFIFAAKWQSTDYSGSDASDDINSSDDEAVSLLNPHQKAYKKKKKTTILMTCPPVWRSKDLRRAIKEIRGVVDQDIEKKEAQKKHWMKKRIPRVQGPPRMAKSLPVHDSMKTPRWAVSTKWLHSLSLEERNEQEALMTEDHVIGDSESSTDPNIDDLEQEEISYDSV